MTERLAYEQLQGRAHQLFLPLLFFCRVPHVRSSRCWRGYCMKQGQYSLRDILYKSPRHCDAQHEELLKKLLQDKDHYLSISSSFHHEQNKTIGVTKADEEAITTTTTPIRQGGLCVSFKPTQTVQLSLCLTALRLLHELHLAGWVHGDSHLGNFVYANGRLYAIDFERSFCTSEPVQHFLDIQEVFGHISAMIVHMERPHEWDMKDIPGIYFHRYVYIFSLNLLDCLIIIIIFSFLFLQTSTFWTNSTCGSSFTITKKNWFAT